MRKGDYEQLLEDLRMALVQDGHSSFAILGITPVALDLVAFLHAIGAEDRLLGIYGHTSPGPSDGPYRSIAQLGQDRPDTVVIASDSDKERLLELAVPYLSPNVRIILAGYAHLQYRDPTFDEVVRTAAVPSLANGYPSSLIHLYQCLQNSARLGLKGIVAEFGIFKGGTTMLLSRFIEHLGQSWRVIGFDTFAGFPAKRSVLDMYEHPDCAFPDEALVRRYLADRNVEIIPGDIVETVHRLEDEDIVVAFVDTDNFTPASAVLEVIQERVVVSGAVVFDHFTGRDRFRYTLGERIAAKRLLADRRFFNLHETGVFFRQC